jgi:hypothetical protein
MWRLNGGTFPELEVIAHETGDSVEEHLKKLRAEFGVDDEGVITERYVIADDTPDVVGLNFLRVILQRVTVHAINFGAERGATKDEVIKFLSSPDPGYVNIENLKRHSGMECQTFGWPHRSHTMSRVRPLALAW